MFRNHEFLHRRYTLEGYSIAQISEEISSSKEAVRKALKQFKIPIREPSQHHGHPSQAKFGTRLSAGKLQKNKRELDVIATINQLKAQGLSLRQIAKILTNLKVSTKNGAASWHPQMIKRIIDMSASEGRS
ncbi:recombinase family protein [Bdellovibrio sp. NC01]|uniref:recombinase family protein n=1 Tax=Bdellovibrio sp. NC01 TaxID=2220073 RepID=UPI00143D88E6|nr:recombinase family protein [Bdellovibrio sp. NC01]